jgi:CRP-like cAMP-binding protein
VIAQSVFGIPTGSTMLALLWTLVVLVVGGALALRVASRVLVPFIDRRWPAAEPLNPSDLAWAEIGEFVERTFRGLPTELARELATRMQQRDVARGTVIIEQGGVPTHFYVIKQGEVEVTQQVQLPEGRSATQIVRRMGRDMFFGEVAIFRRSPCTASVTAATDCVLMALSAADLVAGAGRSAAQGHVLLRSVDRYVAEDRARAARLAASLGARAAARGV